MLIKTKKSWEIPENQVTPEGLYLSRRSIMKNFGLAAGAAMLGPLLQARKAEAAPEIKVRERVDFADGEKLNDFEDITGYNNYYEFGTGKGDPAKNAHSLKPEPWSVTVDGLCEKPGAYALEDLIDFNNLEERIYRLRCVEAWSMVIPWVGVPLNPVLKKLGPKAGARFIRFETLADRSQMPGISSPVLDWPYKEGLRMDEAMNNLAFLVVGLYGKVLPSQNGAPLRLAVPWKYGFKSIKSIVRISFVETMPMTTWWQQNPREYGFYSNVNPGVDHPRWSQSRERRIGEFFKRETLMFNGYGEEVADLYRGMDLSKNF